MNIISTLSFFILGIVVSSCGGGGGGGGGEGGATVTESALNSLSILNENLDQTFQANQLDYTANVGFIVESINIKATSTDTGAIITVNNITIGSNSESQSIALAAGSTTTITIVVTQNSVSKTYTLTVFRQSATSFAEQAYIKASNTFATDYFGVSVALSGDTLAVGAYGVNDGFTDVGAVYIFTRSGTTWSQQAFLKASNTGASFKFGFSVALSGDTLAVGALNEGSSTTGINSTPDDAASNSGAVYIFTRSGTTWGQQAYIKASNTSAFDNFGRSVALSGDTLAVGAVGEDSNSIGINSTPDDTASNAGAVYIFTRNGITWSEQAYVKASNSGAGDNFGHSVTLSGDTLAVGAVGEASSSFGINKSSNNNYIAAGAVYVFIRSNNTWSEQAFVKSSNPNANDVFGTSIEMSGNTLVVGAPREDSDTTGINSSPNNLATDAGAVYVFTRNGSTWSQQAYIKATNAAAFDEFGHNVALAGDTLAVSAPLEDSDTTGINSSPNELANSAGAVYVFTRNGTTWSHQAYVKSSNAGVGDYFGGNVSLSGNTLAVGALNEDSDTTGINSSPNNNADNAGAVYVFE